jgi:hypothetical protein
MSVDEPLLSPTLLELNVIQIKPHEKIGTDYLSENDSIIIEQS